MKQLLILYVSSGLLLSALSIPLILGHVPPNCVYGFRVPATLRAPELWYPANRHAGKWLSITGAVISLSAVILYLVPGMNVDTYALAALAVTLIGLGAAVTSSLVLLNKLQRSR